MHVYIDNLGLNTAKQNKLLLIALAVSMLLHGASLFFNPIKFKSNNNLVSDTVTISRGNMQSATTLDSPELKTYVPEVALDDVKISNLYIADDQIITDINSTTKILSPDALSTLNPNIQAADAQITTKPLELTPTNASQAPITGLVNLQNLLPTDNYTSVLDSKNIAISFAEIPKLSSKITDLKVTKATELIKEVPVITETSAFNEKSPISPLFGVTPKFKQQIKRQLSKAIITIKPKIVQQQLAGSLRFQFTINRDGNLVSSKINKSSGNKELDTLILKMLKDNAPYSKLPNKYPGELLRFSYPISVKLK